MSAFVRHSINCLLFSKCLPTHFNAIRRSETILSAFKCKYSTRSEPKFETVKNEESRKSNKTNEATDEWTLIYRYRHIRIARAFCRLKLYQTIFLTATTPMTVYAYMNGDVTLANCQFFVGLNVFSCLTLYLFGSMFRKVVGIVYVDESGTKTKIAHLTFWGGRKDNVHNIADLAPLGEFNDIRDLFCKIRSNSDDKVLYYISIKFGIIEQPDKFYNVFGTFGEL